MVNVDTVYQRVLALANKEQRGYITPQEFNLLANQAQMSIFIQYIYDIKMAHNPSMHSNDSVFSNELDFLNEKLEPFRSWDYCSGVTPGGTFQTNNEPIPAGIATLPGRTEYLGSVVYEQSDSVSIEIQEVNETDLLHLLRAPLAAPDLTRPVYIRQSQSQIRIYPAIVFPAASATVPVAGTPPPGENYQTKLKCNILTAPKREYGNDVKWGYAVVNEKALYNANESTHFLLHASEEEKLVLKILELAGVTLNKPGIVQIAGTEDGEVTAKQKMA